MAKRRHLGSSACSVTYLWKDTVLWLQVAPASFVFVQCPRAEGGTGEGAGGLQRECGRDLWALQSLQSPLLTVMLWQDFSKGGGCTQRCPKLVHVSPGPPQA